MSPLAVGGRPTAEHPELHCQTHLEFSMSLDDDSPAACEEPCEERPLRHGAFLNSKGDESLQLGPQVVESLLASASEGDTNMAICDGDLQDGADAACISEDAWYPHEDLGAAEDDRVCGPTSLFGKLPGGESNGCSATAVPDTSLADQGHTPAAPPFSAELGNSETHKSGLQLPAPVELEPAVSTLCLVDSSSVMDSEDAADESVKQAASASADAAESASPKLHMPGVPALHDHDEAEVAGSLDTGSATFPQATLATEPCDAIPEPAGGDADSLPLQEAVMDPALVPAANPAAALTSQDAAQDDAACSPTSEFGKLPGGESDGCSATAVPDMSLADQGYTPAAPPSSAELGNSETHKSGLQLPAPVELEPAVSTLCLVDSSSVMDSEDAADESVKQAASASADAAESASPKLHMPGVPALHDHDEAEVAGSLDTGSATFPQATLATEPCDAIPEPAGGDADSLPLQEAVMDPALVPAAHPAAALTSQDAAQDDAACSPTSEFGKLPRGESDGCSATAVPDMSLADQGYTPAAPPSSAELGNSETHKSGLQLPAPVELEPAVSTLCLVDSSSVMDSEDAADESVKQAASASADAAESASPKLHMPGVQALHDHDEAEVAGSLDTGSATFPQATLATEPCDAIPEPAGGDADSLPLQEAVMDPALVPAANPAAALTSQDAAQDDAACSPISEFGKLPGGESDGCSATAVPDMSLADQGYTPAAPPSSAELGNSETHKSGLQLPAPVELEPATSTLCLVDSSSVMDSEDAADESVKQAASASADAAESASPKLHMPGVPALHDHDEAEVAGSLDTGSATFPQATLATEPCDAIPEPAGGDADSLPLQEAVMDPALAPAADPAALLTSQDAAQDDAACSPISEFGKLPGGESNGCSATAVPDMSLADQGYTPAAPPSSAELGDSEAHKSGLQLPAPVELEPATSTLCLVDSSSVMDSEDAADESVKQAASASADAAESASPKLHMPGVPALHDHDEAEVAGSLDTGSATFPQATLATEPCDTIPEPAGGDADSLPLQEAMTDPALVPAATPEAEPTRRAEVKPKLRHSASTSSLRGFTSAKTASIRSKGEAGAQRLFPASRFLKAPDMKGMSNVPLRVWSLEASRNMPV